MTLNIYLITSILKNILRVITKLLLFLKINLTNSFNFYAISVDHFFNRKMKTVYMILI